MLAGLRRCSTISGFMLICLFCVLTKSHAVQLELKTVPEITKLPVGSPVLPEICIIVIADKGDGFEWDALPEAQGKLERVSSLTPFVWKYKIPTSIDRDEQTVEMTGRLKDGNSQIASEPLTLTLYRLPTNQACFPTPTPSSGSLRINSVNLKREGGEIVSPTSYLYVLTANEKVQLSVEFSGNAGKIEPKYKSIFGRIEGKDFYIVPDGKKEDIVTVRGVDPETSKTVQQIINITIQQEGGK